MDFEIGSFYMFNSEKQGIADNGIIIQITKISNDGRVFGIVIKAKTKLEPVGSKISFVQGSLFSGGLVKVGTQIR